MLKYCINFETKVLFCQFLWTLDYKIEKSQERKGVSKDACYLCAPLFSSTMLDWWCLTGNYKGRRNGMDHHKRGGRSALSRLYQPPFCLLSVDGGSTSHPGSSHQSQRTNLQEYPTVFGLSVLISVLRSGLDVNEITGVLTDIWNLATLLCPLSLFYSSFRESSSSLRSWTLYCYVNSFS